MLGIEFLSFVLSNVFFVILLLFLIILFKIILFILDIIFGYFFLKCWNKGLSNCFGFKCFKVFLYFLNVVCLVVIMIV